MKRYLEDEDETPSKETKNLISLADIPFENLQLIIQFGSDKAIFGLILTNSIFYKAFKELYQESIDQIRLWYLNGMKEKRIINSRLLKLFEHTTNSNVKDMDEFKKNFMITPKVENYFSPITLEPEPHQELEFIIKEEIFKMNQQNQSQFVFAGGYLSKILFGYKEGDFSQGFYYDLDIFFIENGMENGDEMILELFSKIQNRSSLKKRYIIIRSGNSINIKSQNRKDTQFILRKVKSIEELLIFFDLDCCRFCYDGKDVYTTKEGLRALKKNHNIVDIKLKNDLYLQRAIKYEIRGISTLFRKIHPLDHILNIDYGNEKSRHQDVLYNRYFKEDEKDEEMYAGLSNIPYERITTIYHEGKDSKGRDFFFKSTTIAKSFEEIVRLNFSPYYKERYHDNHLLKKYNLSKCYLCHEYRPISGLEEEPSSLCYSCKMDDLKIIENLEIDMLRSDMSSIVAVITGGRMKIGYTVAVKLLNAGATVVITTRFPSDALERFRSEKNYDKFMLRLVIYPLNLIGVQSIIDFTKYIKQRFKRIHILINNAAQTIRRPLYYYKKWIEKEHQRLIEYVKPKNPIIVIEPLKSTLDHMYQRLTDEDKLFKIDEINLEKNNKFGEPIDSRDKNSWNLPMGNITEQEYLEVQMINNIAPSLLCSHLMDALKVTKDDLNPSYIINVASHEGQFNTTGKTDFHIHNNISKAGLNMLTRSSSNYFSKNGIKMYSVDTGWISSGIETFKEPPLSLDDGAYRILHPIFTNMKEIGILLKDYKKVDW